MKYRIVNRKRFIIACTVTILLIVCLLSLVFSRIVAKDYDDVRYINVKVKPGDTVWALARTYGDPEKDVREVIYEIEKLNGIENAVIIPGQELLIPE